jgi:hypothetical protein
MEGGVIKVGHRPGGGVIADDHDDVARQLAGAVPKQQVSQTVLIGRNQNGYLRAVVRQCQVVLDVERFGQRLEVAIEVRGGNIEPIEVPFQPREEQVAATIQMVVAVQEATVVRHQELGDCRHHALAREGHRCTQKQDGGVLHFPPMILRPMLLSGLGSKYEGIPVESEAAGLADAFDSVSGHQRTQLLCAHNQ